MKKRSSPLVSWILVAACAAGIFLIVPLARFIQNIVSSIAGRAFFGYAVIGCAAAAFVCAAAALRYRLKIRSLSRYLWLGLIAAAYIIITIRLWEGPEEAVHFLEYGLLIYLLFRALSYYIQDPGIYPTVFFCGTIVGTLDEIIQWAVPGRYWDIRDVGLNALACGLFLLALILGIRPRIKYPRITSRSICVSSILLTANIILLGLCLSNTPDRVIRYTEPFPFLHFLRSEEAMSESRNVYQDPDIGEFSSRLSLTQLKEQDESRSGEFAWVLREWKDRPYDQFLRHFPSSLHPFLYEMRVHLFRRDKRLARSREVPSPKRQAANRFIAYKENLILKKYFGYTLAKTDYQWPPEKEKNIIQGIDPSEYYRSPVGTEVISLPQGTLLWIIIGGILILIIVGNIIFSRLPGSRRPPSA